MAADGNVVVEAFTELAPTYEETVDREVREFCGLGYRDFIGRLADLAVVRPDAETPAGANGRRCVLDVASGTALSSLEIAERMGGRWRVIGLDITPAMQRIGAENIRQAGRAGRISQVGASAMAMPFGSGSFEVVICGLGTHHMQVVQLLAEARRVLGAEGRLILADVGAPARWRVWWARPVMRLAVMAFRAFWRSARGQAEADAFDSLHTAGEWRRLLHECGFRGIEIREWPPRRFWYPCAVIMTAVKGDGA